jgi:hypothetical protein
MPVWPCKEMLMKLPDVPALPLFVPPGQAVGARFACPTPSILLRSSLVATAPPLSRSTQTRV